MEVKSVSSRRWTAGDVVTYRAGRTYPKLILGAPALTRVLCDISTLEPVSLLGLPDAALVRHFNLQRIVGTLVRRGIVTKLSRTGRLDRGSRTTLILNREHPAYAELRVLLRTIERLDPDVAPVLDVRGMLKYPQTDAVDVRSLFGTPRRTLAIILAHLQPGIRQRTMSRCLGLNPAERPKVIETLVRDGILCAKRAPNARYHLIKMTDSFWSPALGRLIDSLVVLEPHFHSKALTASALDADDEA